MKNIHLSLGHPMGVINKEFRDLKETTDNLVKQKDLFDINQQLRSRFFVNWKKLIAVFDKMHMLLIEEEYEEKHIRKIFDDVYSLLSEFPEEYVPTEEIELTIQKLEEAYARL